MIRIIRSSDTAAVDALLRADASRDPRVIRAAGRIVDAVKTRGDEALLAYARRFDLLTGELEVSPREIREGAARVARDLRRAIASAADNVRRVSALQLPRRFVARPIAGVTVEQRVIPLERAGCYVPGGRYPLPSSLIMTAVPAVTAGVRDVIAVCPRPDDAVMAAFVESGATRLFRIGGAHAIAALAYGTPTIPRVQRIAGPGNAYVAAAKAIVARDCPIDFVAGPSEILIVSEGGRPSWIAADLIAQAEHDPDARAILVTSNRLLARAVAKEIGMQMPESGPARESIAMRGGIVLTRTSDEAIALANRMSPEHAVCDDERTAKRLVHAGTVFVGEWSAQAFGDYMTGSNHVLPTGGAARFRGGLSSADFVKVSTIQRVTRRGARAIAGAGVALATAEGLTAHAASMRMRT